MKFRWVFIIILLYTALSFAAKEGWYDFMPGIEKAEKENKHVLIDFYTDWCHWCKVMDEKTFSETVVAQKMKDRYISIKLHAEDTKEKVTFLGQEYNNVELTRAFGVTGYPSLAFLNARGEMITLIPGFVPADQFITILEYIDQECYLKDVSFEEFQKTGKCPSEQQKN